MCRVISRTIYGVIRNLLGLWVGQSRGQFIELSKLMMELSVKQLMVLSELFLGVMSRWISRVIRTLDEVISRLIYVLSEILTGY